MRLSRVRAEVRSQRYGIAMGAVALLVAVGAPAYAVEGVTTAATSVGQALKISKQADKRSKQANKRSKQALSLAKKGKPGPKGPNGDTGPQGPAGSNAQFNGATAGGSLTGTYPNPTLGAGVVGTSELANLSVTLGKIGFGAVDSSKLFSPSVDDTKLYDAAVTSAKIKNGEVEGPDLGTLTLRTATVAVTGGGAEQNGNWDTNSDTAACLAGEVLITGGADWTNSTVNKELLIVESRPTGANSWSAVGGNDTGATEELRVHALCLES